MANINNLSANLVEILVAYSKEVTEGLEAAKEQAANNTVKILRETSPEGKTKRYKKGWRVTQRGSKQIVHNKTDYQLTHLLEYGHAKFNGGRVAAKVHIRPAEDQSIKDFISGAERVMQR